MTCRSLEAGGVHWRFRTWGDPGRPAIVFLHGFTWDGASWDPIAATLSETFYCVAPDLPGHGATSAPEPIAEWSFDRVIEALAEALDALGVRRPRLVGYSMGGRVALSLAVRRPEAYGGLVLIGATPGLASETERAGRRQDDAELARQLVADGTPAFLERWMTLPLFDSLRAIGPERLARLNCPRAAQDPRGLAASLLAMGTGSQPYLGEALSSLELPTLLVVGDRDAKFRAIAEAMLAELPRGRMEVVAACGHSVPFERPEQVSALVTAFFAEALVASSNC